MLNPAKYKDQWQNIYERRNKTLLLKVGSQPHEREKIGPGTQVIKTDRGWLLIYHAVGQVGEKIAGIYGLSEKIDRGYSICGSVGSR